MEHAGAGGGGRGSGRHLFEVNASKINHTLGKERGKGMLDLPGDGMCRGVLALKASLTPRLEREGRGGGWQVTCVNK